ncbi:hypothetical protein SKAU_G00257430 [Synaphobranchus kaupii]|uniref:Uncharacterized protein n=1 Tax=Synaphobranchus kaupii TaxID=118154 RepID=A0A9Q1F427_SYNKA|nr:hypothetical protein SKAU_G00257430 [Synaphobranchus kaupii]
MPAAAAVEDDEDDDDGLQGGPLKESSLAAIFPQSHGKRLPNCRRAFMLTDRVGRGGSSTQRDLADPEVPVSVPITGRYMRKTLTVLNVLNMLKELQAGRPLGHFINKRGGAEMGDDSPLIVARLAERQHGDHPRRIAVTPHGEALQLARHGSGHTARPLPTFSTGGQVSRKRQPFTPHLPTPC